MGAQSEERVRWTDPTGLRAQAARQAERQTRTPAPPTWLAPARDGNAPAAPPDPDRLEEILVRLRATSSATDDETLVQLAWQYFAAGFVARSGEAPSAGALTPMPAPEPDDSLADLVASLTPRRLEVLRLVAKGLTNREIGQVLGISAYTVKAHVAGVLETLDLTNRTEAAVALREYESQHEPA